MEIGYNIGGIVPNNVAGVDGKFIVVASPKTQVSRSLLLYAINYEHHSLGSAMDHRDIKEHFRLKQYVLGGGKIRESDGTVTLWDFSGEYGGVPYNALVKFGELLADGSRVEAKEHDCSVEWADWRQFGFSEE